MIYYLKTTNVSVRSKLINKLFKDATKLAKNYDYMVKCDTELCSEISFLFAYDLDTCTDKDIRSFIERKFKNLPEGCDEFTGLVIKDCTFVIEPVELVNICATDIDILEQGTVYLRGVIKAKGVVEVKPTVSKLAQATAKSKSLALSNVYRSVILLQTVFGKAVSNTVLNASTVIKSIAQAKALPVVILNVVRSLKSTSVARGISNTSLKVAKLLEGNSRIHSLAAVDLRTSKVLRSLAVSVSSVYAEVTIISAELVSRSIALGVAVGNTVKAVIINSTASVKSIASITAKLSKVIQTTATTKATSITKITLANSITGTAKSYAHVFANAVTGLVEGFAIAKGVVVSSITRVLNAGSIVIIDSSSASNSILTRVIKSISNANARVVSTVKATFTIVAQAVSKSLITASVIVSKVANAASSARARVLSESKIVKIAAANSVAKSLITSVAMIKVIIVNSLSRSRTTSSATAQLAKIAKLTTISSTTFTATGVSQSAYDTDAQTFFTAASITDTTQKNAVNTLVTSLKSAGVWTKMVAIYPFVGGTASSHAVNLKTPGTYNLTFVGGVTHSANGVVGDGTTGYYDTGMPLNTLAQNNTSAFIYSRTDLASFGRDLGSSDGSTALIQICPRTTSNNMRASMMTNSFQETANSTSLGFFGATRTSSSVEVHCINTTTVSKSSVSFAPGARNIYGLARNNSGTAGDFSPRQQAFACIGQGITTGTGSEYTALYNAVVAYQTALSRNV